MIIKVYSSKWLHTLRSCEVDSLSALGFNFVPEPGETDHHNASDVPTPNYVDKSKVNYDGNYASSQFAAATLVHCCAEDGNMLSRPITHKDREVFFRNITKEDDFTTKAALNAVLADIVGPGDMFFFCSPCTGGSSWQHLNLSIAFQRGCTSTVHKLIGHWDLHWRLWENFEVVARHCKRVGASCILEWPAGCAYWREDRVRAFLDELGFVSTWFDGCMYGLRARHDKRNRLIKKPWRMACLNSCLPDLLNKRCDKQHEHYPCQGQDTVLTQSYTHEIRKIIHQARAKDATKVTGEGQRERERKEEAGVVIHVH